GSVEAGDLDGDGKADLVLAYADYSKMAVYRNINNGGALNTNSFAPRVDFPTAAGANVALGDIDGDGKLDIVSANSSANTISVFRNIGVTGVIASNSFAPRVDFGVGGYPFSATIGDIDGDGKLDIALANSDSYTVSVFRNVSTPGSFTSASLATRVDYPTGA